MARGLSLEERRKQTKRLWRELVKMLGCDEGTAWTVAELLYTGNNQTIRDCFEYLLDRPDYARTLLVHVRLGLPGCPAEQKEGG